MGSWLAARLSRLGSDATGFARLTASTASLFHLAGLAGRVESRNLDLRDRAKVEQMVIAAAPEIVFHIATPPRPGDALKRPLDSFDTNIIGTLNLLNALRRVPGIRAVVVVMGDTLVEPGWAPGGPIGPRDGSDPSAASLAGAELVVDSYRASFLQPEDGIGLATLRPCRLVGGGAEARGLAAGHRHAAPVPAVGPELDFGAGAEPGWPAAGVLLRPFLHVLDALEAALDLAEALCRKPGPFGRAWTLGPLDPASCMGAGMAVMPERAGRMPPLGRGSDAGLRPGDDASCRLPTNKGANARRGSADTGSVDTGSVGTGSAGPGSADGLASELAGALCWHPVLDAETAVAWTIEGEMRLARDAHGGFVFEQIDRLITLKSSLPPTIAPAGALARRPAETLTAVLTKAADVLPSA